MQVRYIGGTLPLELTHGKIYEVLSIEKGWYRIIDDTGAYDGEELPGYLYPPELFEISNYAPIGAARHIYISPMQHIIDRMEAGELVVCPKCGEGILQVSGNEPPQTAHLICCTKCKFKIIQN